MNKTIRTNLYEEETWQQYARRKGYYIKQPKTHGYTRPVFYYKPSIWYTIFEIGGWLAWVYIIVTVLTK